MIKLSIYDKQVWKNRGKYLHDFIWKLIKDVGYQMVPKYVNVK